MGRARGDTRLPIAGKNPRRSPTRPVRDQTGDPYPEERTSRNEIRRCREGRLDPPSCRRRPFRDDGPGRMSRNPAPGACAPMQSAFMFSSVGSENTHAPACARQASFSLFLTTAPLSSSPRSAFAPEMRLLFQRFRAAVPGAGGRTSQDANGCGRANHADLARKVRRNAAKVDVEVPCAIVPTPAATPARAPPMVGATGGFRRRAAGGSRGSNRAEIQMRSARPRRLAANHDPSGRRERQRRHPCGQRPRPRGGAELRDPRRRPSRLYAEIEQRFPVRRNGSRLICRPLLIRRGRPPLLPMGGGADFDSKDNPQVRRRRTRRPNHQRHVTGLAGKAPEGSRYSAAGGIAIRALASTVRI